MSTGPFHMVEYICTYCGMKARVTKTGGRPSPGKCSRKKNGGPHTWRFNRNIC